MAEVQVKTLSIKHEAIMDYLLGNPSTALGPVATHFGVTQAWLSVIIHSDAFQSKLKERSDELFGATIVPLREQILGLAHVGVEKLGLALENASPISDKQFIADTTDSVLKNLGYSPKSAPSDPAQLNVQNNFITVDKESLALARDKMQGLAPAIIEGTVNVENETAPTEGVQTSRADREG